MAVFPTEEEKAEGKGRHEKAEELNKIFSRFLELYNKTTRKVLKSHKIDANKIMREIEKEMNEQVTPDNFNYIFGKHLKQY